MELVVGLAVCGAVVAAAVALVWWRSRRGEPVSLLADLAEAAAPRPERIPLVTTDQVLFPAGFVPLDVRPEGWAAIAAARERGLDTVLVASPRPGEVPRFATRAVAPKGFRPDRFVVIGVDRVALADVRMAPYPSAVAVELEEAQPDEEALRQMAKRASRLAEPPDSARSMAGRLPDGPRWVDQLLRELFDADRQRELFERPILERLAAVLEVLPPLPVEAVPGPPEPAPFVGRDVLCEVADATPAPIAAEAGATVPRAAHALLVPVDEGYRPGTRFGPDGLLRVDAPEVWPAIRHFGDHRRGGWPVVLVARRDPAAPPGPDNLAERGVLFGVEYSRVQHVAALGEPAHLGLGGRALDAVRLEAIYALRDGTLVGRYVADLRGDHST